MNNNDDLLQGIEEIMEEHADQSSDEYRGRQKWIDALIGVDQVEVSSEPSQPGVYTHTFMPTRTRPLYYSLNAQGNPVPCGIIEANALLSNAKKRTVARTFLRIRGVRVEISTVFLVIDHAFLGGPPILWETMTFSRHPEFDNLKMRHRSRDAASERHNALVGEIIANLRLHRHQRSARRIQVAKRRLARGESVLTGRRQ